MSTPPSNNTTPETPTGPSLMMILFVMFTTFLSALGMTIITPVLPFIVKPFVSDEGALATAVGWLMATYAICQFIAAPGLGILSDRFGRRPLLLICLLGSTLGYLLFGIGGALWVLFLGRVIDGITGGDFSILAAYVGDVVPPEERGKRFGQISGVVGVGFIVGPVIGGFVSKLGYTAPMYLSAAILFATTVWGFFAMPESLLPENRIARISLADLNPLVQIRNIFGMARLRWLMVTSLVYGMPFAMFSAVLALLAMDKLAWQPDTIGLLFLVIGAIDIVMQTFLAGWLLEHVSAVRLCIAGLIGEAISYSLIGTVALVPAWWLIVAGTVFFAIGSGLLEPALNGMISAAAGPQEQGMVQGGAQALRALTEIGGPLLAGALYTQFGGESPFWLGAAMVLAAIVTIQLAAQHHQSQPPIASAEPANG